MFDVALPGTLPVLNGEALRMAVRFGLAIDAEIGRTSVFDRKNYFYPDLPKGYQTSQLAFPIVGKGSLTFTLDDGSTKTIGITRAHMEEDAGKSLHDAFPDATGIDLNRAGTPLLEIVSEPELRSAKEAVAYLKKLHSLISTSAFPMATCRRARCAAMPTYPCARWATARLAPAPKSRTSTRSASWRRPSWSKRSARSILLRTVAASSRKPASMTPTRNETRSMRSKEVANDYRYFPEPDLSADRHRRGIHRGVSGQSLPELPDVKSTALPATVWPEYLRCHAVLSADRDTADFFESVAKAGGDAKLAANWVMVDLQAVLNKSELTIGESPVSAEQLGGLIARIRDNTISSKIARTVFEAMIAGEGSADSIIEHKGLRQVTDTGAIETIIDAVLAANPAQVEQYRAGSEKVFGFLVGQVMKESKGKANPGQVNDILKSKLAG
jgi:aspartyl-tRNA(Asn)/glutamyl-tRNA(Gln) amidotransferase subunit B